MTQNRLISCISHILQCKCDVSMLNKTPAKVQHTIAHNLFAHIIHLYGRYCKIQVTQEKISCSTRQPLEYIMLAMWTRNHVMVLCTLNKMTSYMWQYLRYYTVCKSSLETPTFCMLAYWMLKYPRSAHLQEQWRIHVWIENWLKIVVYSRDLCTRYGDHAHINQSWAHTAISITHSFTVHTLIYSLSYSFIHSRIHRHYIPKEHANTLVYLPPTHYPYPPPQAPQTVNRENIYIYTVCSWSYRPLPLLLHPSYITVSHELSQSPHLFHINSKIETYNNQQYNNQLLNLVMSPL